MDASAVDHRGSEAQVAAALARCATGERSALRVIYEIEAPRLLGVALRILRRRDLAEDAVHESFLRVWRSARSFDPARGLARHWLAAIVRNRALTMLREEGRFAPEEALPVAEPDETLLRLPETSALRRCLDALAPLARRAILLAYVHGMSHGELAGRLALPLGSAKSHIRRGLMSLQKCMG